MRKELSFGNNFSNEGLDDREFGTIAGNIECEVIEDMEVLQYKMHRPIDCDVVTIIRNTIMVFIFGIVVPLLLLWIKDYLLNIGCWKDLILLIVLAIFLYNIVMAAKHMYKYFQKKETSKGNKYNFRQMLSNSKHEQKFEEIKKYENDFREFYNNANEIFGKLQKSDSSSQFFKDTCSFHVCPGSRAGGNNPDVVEIFWGAHPVKRIDKKNNFKLVTEDGVTLMFYLLPDGHVTITLYPAKNELMRPIEDCIIVYRHVKANWLLKANNMKPLWHYFMAYTECTSLIGTPSIWQKLRIFWLKYTRTLYVGDVQQPIRGLQHLRKIVTFALTVGLSGFLLVSIQQCQKETVEDYSPLIKQTNQYIEEAQKVQSELLKETQLINANIDSLIKSVSHIQKKSVVTDTKK